MDMMLLGETVVASATSQKNLGFWMPAGGNDGVGGVEVFYASHGGAFDVGMETKSSDEADAAATSIGSVSIGSSTTTPATYKFDVTNAKDLVRYAVTSTRDARIHLQYAQPLWHPN
jgi:ApbE superfamily uncharacterized protein (UPF0280 family)